MAGFFKAAMLSPFPFCVEEDLRFDPVTIGGWLVILEVGAMPASAVGLAVSTLLAAARFIYQRVTSSVSSLHFPSTYPETSPGPV